MAFFLMWSRSRSRSRDSMNTQHFLWLSLVIGVVIVVLVWLSMNRIRRSNRQLYTDSIASATDSTCVYDQTAFTSNNHVVFYYAPWCPYCTSFRPEFDKAARKASASGLDVCFVTVNITSQSQSQNQCLKYKGVTAYPTVLFETGPVLSPPYQIYNGLRNANDLYTWVVMMGLSLLG